MLGTMTAAMLSENCDAIRAFRAFTWFEGQWDDAISANDRTAFLTEGLIALSEISRIMFDGGNSST